MTTEAIVAESLTKVYRHRAGEVVALKRASFKLRSRRLLSVLGPNGAGKTTLIRILATQLRPTSGDAWVLGYHVVDNAWLVRWRIGVVPQEATLYNMITPWEFVYYYSRVRGLSKNDARERTRSVLEMLGLWELRGVPAYKLSGGQKRRVLIAAALAPDPDVLFLDEPTVGLDPLARRGLWSKIRSLVRSGKTIVLTTHYMDEAEALSDEIMIIDKGVVLAMGGVEELRRLAPYKYRVEVFNYDGVIKGSLATHYYGNKTTAYFNDLNQAMEQVKRVISEGFPANISPISLEDVFIKLVGRAGDGPGG